ncbi:amino acid adenylation domain-containing protein [Pseudomonas entomophila]|uniref:amino acid adenylation domain-containing protein n=1 Tax=Pseudomonas entomophila TaxID=312306 RepID=UPI0015E485C6|nr:amino acid adenylation domain-containing protein [Pseudomonas entomophila]MBA1191283.1 amino acid adenylation domain-containing protein [Pseudomonas entomophila]
MKTLTSMQAACWSGRSASAELGNVAAHLYVEFEGPALEVERLEQALAQVSRRHPMLRLRLTADGEQAIAPLDAGPALEVEDLRTIPAEQAAAHLARKRDRWTHQQLDLRHRPGVRVGLTRLPDRRTRLHIDADMIAVDPSSLRVLIEDLAMAYDTETPETAWPTVPSFFDWWDAARHDPALSAARERDRAWWRQRLDRIAPAPSLPRLDSPRPPRAHSERWHAWLTPAQGQALQGLAREQRVSLSTLMLGLFATVLGAHTGDRRLRLNVPSFWRAPLVEHVERIVGEFANVLIVDVDLEAAAHPAALCQQLAEQLIERLEHSAWSGVDLMRELSRHHGSPHLAPVVFTAALDLPDGPLFSPRVHRLFGSLVWTISQGPQVALDVQVARADDGILINWDVRLDALPRAWVAQLFDRFMTLVRTVSTTPEALSRPLPERPHERPLNPLQQAYLLGRGTQVPLGGVAMQEFREYRGTLEVTALRARLIQMVQQHPSLRTHIDAHGRVQFEHPDMVLNLDEVDLSHLPMAEALDAIAARREAYAHAHFALDRSPWNVTVFHLAANEQVVFARLDALIVDGRAIAALLVELLGGQAADVPAAPMPPQDAVPTPEQRQADADYWTHKLASVTGVPRLPWARPLEQIGQSRYQRQGLRLPKADFTALCRLGARHGLFNHATLTAVVLEVLSHWLRDGDLCVAMPVAPPSDAALANRSSFLAINWARASGAFAERAAALQTDVLEGLQHLAFSGVDLARLLFERHGPGPVLPVVITNGLSWPTLPAGSPLRLTGGLTQTPQVALDVRFSRDANGDLLLDIDHAIEAVSPACVKAMLQALTRTLRWIVSEGEFAIMPGTVVDTDHYRLNSPLDEACEAPFLQQIARRLFDPDNAAPALISGERTLSYAALGEQVARAIAALHARGLRPGQVVAICLPRGPAHTTLTLACALTGLVWVPIDAAAPAQRRQYLLNNCQPALVVLADGDAHGHPASDVERLLATSAPLPADLPDLSLSEAPAYYLYTSGTTGQPKCVVLNNRATANVIGHTLADWAVTAEDVLLSVTPLHHDMSVFDVFGSLAAGATLVLPLADEEKDALRWHALIARHQVSLWCSVPAMLDMLLACRGTHTMHSLRLIAQGGDYLKPAVIAELRARLPHARLVSLGGPTETTIWSIWHAITAQDQGQVPYGRPLPGNRYLVLDAQGEHCPVGVVGRIHTAGVNLALGYLQDGQLRQTDFVTVTDERGEPVRAFRTGDCGRYREDGVLLFDSRVNGYVKIRGVRVSLPDVEAALASHPALRQVLVVDHRAPGTDDLCIGALYVCAEGATPGLAELRAHARQHLPDSHVPTRLLPVTALPLSQNGKPDRPTARQWLEAATPATAHPAQGHPVLDVYAQVLALPPGHTTDASTSFLSLGLRPQHLKAVAAGLRQRFSVSLSPAQLLRCRDAQDVERLLADARA